MVECWTALLNSQALRAASAPARASRSRVASQAGLGASRAHPPRVGRRLNPPRRRRPEVGQRGDLERVEPCRRRRNRRGRGGRRAWGPQSSPGASPRSAPAPRAFHLATAAERSRARGSGRRPRRAPARPPPRARRRAPGPRRRIEPHPLPDVLVGVVEHRRRRRRNARRSGPRLRRGEVRRELERREAAAGRASAARPVQRRPAVSTLAHEPAVYRGVPRLRTF